MSAPPPSRSGSSKMSLRDKAVAAALLIVMGAELGARVAGSVWLQHLASAAMIAVVPLAAPRLGFREAYLLTLCAVLSLILYLGHDHPEAAIEVGLDQATFLMAFILLLSLVQEAASSSRSVAETGMWLTRQPPGRRFLSLYGGTNLMGVLFNLGVVSLLAPLIRRGVEESAPGDPLNPIRERRQLNAMLRGFAWCVVWSPTAIAPLALLDLIDGIDRGRWLVLGFGITLAVMALGWVEDRIAWRNYVPRRKQAEPVPWRAVTGFFTICGLLLVLTLLAMTLSGGSVVLGLMLACPLLMAIWLVAQAQAQTQAPTRAQVLSRAGHRMREILGPRLTVSASLAVTLACSGFIGRAGAALIPVAELADQVGLSMLPGYVFLTAVSVLVAAFSQFGLSPIMMAVFFGSLLGALPELPADPTLTALAIACGWGLSMTSSPFATVVLLTARETGHSGRELSWYWNLHFSILTAILIAAIFFILTGGQ